MPAGNDPLVTSHVNGPVPPVDCSCCEYATSLKPAGKVVVVIVNVEATVIENVRVACCGGVELSLTSTAKEDVPKPVGVPLITPELDSVSPAGSLAVVDHV